MTTPEHNNGSDAVNLAHARSADQLRDMEDIEQRNICFMCPEHVDEFFGDYDGLIDEAEHSFLVENRFPYENTELHYMVIPKQHATKLAELSDEFMVEVLSFAQSLEEQYQVVGGGLAMRFGESDISGASASHIHAHIIVPRTDIESGDKPVRFRISPRY